MLVSANADKYAKKHLNLLNKGDGKNTFIKIENKR